MQEEAEDRIKAPRNTAQGCGRYSLLLSPKSRIHFCVLQSPSEQHRAAFSNVNSEGASQKSRRGGESLGVARGSRQGTQLFRFRGHCSSELLLLLPMSFAQPARLSKPCRRRRCEWPNCNEQRALSKKAPPRILVRRSWTRPSDDWRL